MKRLLAYHSIENIGIILMGLGLALLGRTYGEPIWVALGLGGAMLHTWNHGLFKSLLFLGAGSVIHATGTRAIDRMGGLARRMPWTAAPRAAGFSAHVGEPVLERAMILVDRGERTLRRLHVLQQGRSQLYVLYMLLALVLLFLWLVPCDGLVSGWFEQGVNP